MVAALLAREHLGGDGLEGGGALGQQTLGEGLGVVLGASVVVGLAVATVGLGSVVAVELGVTVASGLGVGVPPVQSATWPQR